MSKSIWAFSSKNKAAPDAEDSVYRVPPGAKEPSAEEISDEQAAEQTEEQAESPKEATEAPEAAGPLTSWAELRKAVEAIWDEREAARKEEEERSQRLSSMSEDERRLFDLEERERVLTEKEAILQEREHVNNVLKLCSEHDLPIALAETIARGSTAETIDDVIKTIASEWHAALAEKVRAQARQEVPRSARDTKSKEEFSLSAMARKARKI